MHFIVLSSSRGTTFQAVLDRIADGSLIATCRGLIADREDRGCAEKARAAHLPVMIVAKKENESREEYDKRLNEAIQDLVKQKKPATSNPSTELRTGQQPATIIAALGWMFIFSPWFIRQWKNRIINVHPALLPKFGGEGMYGTKVHEAVLASGDKESGITIHLMDEGVDTGRILLQKNCPVHPDDSADTLKERVQALEKEWYPKVLQMIETGEMQLP